DTTDFRYCQCTTSPLQVFSYSGTGVQLTRRDCSVCNGQGVQRKRNIQMRLTQKTMQKNLLFA
ncbi:MAG: hypothetical protein IKV66_08670, partial [Clostridia bacterium]|nr:hypothetical protein [Clostridia bacterium]